mmetsp:Transcript_40888/g.63829  ORF Transcript_40888/g.63829 Transcript_40888/m.63829 type:complete len:219 (-) Transcript_40888:28-684(-)
MHKRAAAGQPVLPSLQELRRPQAETQLSAEDEAFLDAAAEQAAKLETEPAQSARDQYFKKLEEKPIPFRDLEISQCKPTNQDKLKVRIDVLGQMVSNQKALEAAASKKAQDAALLDAVQGKSGPKAANVAATERRYLKRIIRSCWLYFGEKGAPDNVEELEAERKAKQKRKAEATKLAKEAKYGSLAQGKPGGKESAEELRHKLKELKGETQGEQLAT